MKPAADPTAEPQAQDPRPQISLPRKGRPTSVVLATVALLAPNQRVVFRRGKDLVAVVETDPSGNRPGSITVETLSPANGAAYLERAWCFVAPMEQSPNAEVPHSPGPNFVTALLSHAQTTLAFPELRTVTDIQLPYRLADGSFALTPIGDYHPATGTFTSRNAIPVPVWSGDSDAFLTEYFADFEFATPQDRSISLLYPFSLACRVIIAQMGGLYPLIGFEANAPGTGKDAQPRMGQTLVLGRAVETPAPVDLGKFDTVMETILLNHKIFAHFSNVNRVFNSPYVERMLTARIVAVRIFKEQDDVEVEHNCLLSFSTNGGTLGGDLARRSYISHLRWTGGDPNRRTFARPNLEAWAADPNNRARFIAFVLHWLNIAAAGGFPDGAVTRTASFAVWSKYVALPVALATSCDPLQPRTDDADALPEHAPDSAAGEENDFAYLAQLLNGEKLLNKSSQRVDFIPELPMTTSGFSPGQLRDMVAIIQEHDPAFFAHCRLTKDMPPADYHAAAIRFGLALSKIANRTFKDWSCTAHRPRRGDGALRSERCRYTFSLTPQT